MHDASHPRVPQAEGTPAHATPAGIPAGLWEKCPKCRAMLYVKELERNLRVCDKCQYHFQLSSAERLALLVDPGRFTEFDAELAAVDPLLFPDYAQKLAAARQKTGMPEAFRYGDAEITGMPVVFGVADFAFIAGSMSTIVGEKVTRALERGTALGRPVVLVTTSGGARMQEGILSLMQMAKTSAAAARLKAAGQLYIVVMTDPTYAGVLASFASLGDIIITEPGTRIGFASPRMIEQNLKAKMPASTQSAESQLSHGMVDMVVHRRELRSVLGKLLAYLTPAPTTPPAEEQVVAGMPGGR